MELTSLYPLFINLGVPELSIIVVLVLILFGPGKLPGVMKALGDGVKQFKDASNNGIGHPEDKRTASQPVEPVARMEQRYAEPMTAATPAPVEKSESV